MENINHLHKFMSDNKFRADYIAALLEQGIELERLKSEVEEATKSEKYETTVRILQGERFLSAVSVGSLA